MNHTDDFHLVELLKTCAKKKDLIHGTSLHAHILKRGLLHTCPHLASSIVSMYVKCGALSKAQEAFDELPIRNVVSWNSLISGYAQMGHAREALSCFEQMQNEGLVPDSVTFTCTLKACGSIGDIAKGKQIHDEIIDGGLMGRNVVLGTALVDMYAKCGMLLKARQVHAELFVRNVISWSALISAYAQQGQAEEALKCFELMQGEGIAPNKVTFTSALKACGSTGNIVMGECVHNDIVNRGLLRNDVVLGTALVDMYAKCGMLKKAQEVHDKLEVRSEASWNALISGHVLQNQSHAAVECFERMQGEGFLPDAVTFIGILKACGNIGAFHLGKHIHDEIVKNGLLEKNSVLGNTLVDMYAKCGKLAKAKHVLEELRIRDVISWNSLLTGYIQEGQGYEALSCFEQMQGEGLCPDTVTFLCVLKACGITRSILKGKQIHHKISDRHMLEKNVVLGTALVDMYAKCGELAKAKKVLEELSVRNNFSWCALITGYVEHGHGHDALNCFEQMKSEGFMPDVVTYTCILKACGSTGAIEQGSQIHDEIVSKGLLGKKDVLGNALVDMYAKCGVPVKAQKVLEELPFRNEISWSALIAGYVQQGQSHEALNCFEQMRQEGFSPDVITFTCILKACGSIGAIDKGKQIHDEIISRNCLEKDVMLGTALVDMYAKCGALIKAQQVLQRLPVRNAFTWSALIAGYAQKGIGKNALECLEQMQREGFCPDAVTFLCVLNACSHSGLLDEAEQHFRNMSRNYGIKPDIEHHTCMVVIFGYAGCFDKAMSVIKGMPSSGFPSVWIALLGGCKKWGNVNIGRLAFDQTIKSDSSCVAAYVLMANIYAAAGMQEDAEKIEVMRMRNTVWKITGDGKPIDMTHSQSTGVYEKVKKIALKMSEEGYSPNVCSMIR